MKCSDFSWDDLRESDRDLRPFEVGDVVWNPKGGGAHLLVGEEIRQYAWVTVPVLICECGYIDMEDHHVFVLRKAAVRHLTNRSP